MPAKDIIEFSSVSFSFPRESPLFTDLSFGLMSEAFYLMRGPSGAGKSTLLRLINGLEEPLEGKILFKGRPLCSYSPPLLRRSVLYIQQIPTVIDASVRDNILLPFTFKNNIHMERPDDDRLKTLLDDFVMQGVGLDDNALVLSTGQLQRLCLIRGILLSPEVLLLDEPTSALDAESGRVVESAIRRLNRESGLTVLIVSHHELEFERTTPVVLEVAEGKIREVEWDKES